MSSAFQVGLFGSVASAGGSPGILTGLVENAGDAPETLTGSLSRDVVDAYDASSTAIGYRIKLDGSWVSDDDVIGPVTISESIDSHTSQATFGLVGSAYSVLTSEQAWTRTPVQIYWYQGQPDNVQETLRFAGYIFSAKQVSSHGPILDVTCGDQATLYDRYELCYESPPFAGYTRGYHVRQLLESAGITQYRVPSGETYGKPVQAVNRRLFDYLKEFVEPERWAIRWLSDGTCEVFAFALKKSPIPPDHTWTADDWMSVEIEPPSSVASRWVVTGTQAIEVDDAGFETTTTVTEIWGWYARKVATQQQDASGNVTSTSMTPESESFRLVSKVVDAQTKQGDRLVLQETTSYGWYNPRAAWAWNDDGGGPIGDGYDYVAVYIDEADEYVQWMQERWIEIGFRRTSYAYDGNGDLSSTTVETWRYNRRVMAVKNVGDSGPTISNVWIHGDDMSYSTQNEIYELAERQIMTTELDTVTGAVAREIQDTYGYYSPKCYVDGPITTYYVLYDGSGQVDMTQDLMLTQQQVGVNVLTEDGQVKGRIELTSGYTVSRNSEGAYSWGEFSSNRSEERFTVLEGKEIQYNVLSESQYEIVTFEAGKRKSETVMGRLPSTRFMQSAWTRYTQQPFQLLVDDSTLATWFGYAPEIIASDYVQSLDEARQLYLYRRSRALCHKVTVTRPETISRCGDTVLLSSPTDTLYHRGIIVDIKSSRAPNGQAMATYVLEVPI